MSARPSRRAVWAWFALILVVVACVNACSGNSPHTVATVAPSPSPTATPAVRKHHHHVHAVVAATATATSTPTGPAGCHVQRATVRVLISAARWPNLAAHDRAAEKTHPRILHLDRSEAALHRSQSLRGIPTKPGFDRDEYPPAESREGGTGADVAYIPLSENRSEGAVRRNVLLPYCDTQKFRLVVVP